MLISSDYLDKTESLLEDAIYLEESMNDISAVPVIENSRLGCNIVSYDDIRTLSDQYECLEEDALIGIAIANDLDPDNIAVSIREEDIMLEPSIVNNFSDRFVVDPLIVDEETDIVVNAIIDEALESCDESIIDILEEDTNVILNELFDDLPEGQRAALKKMVLARKKESQKRNAVYKHEWLSDARKSSNKIDYKMTNRHWRDEREKNGTGSMIRNALALNAKNRGKRIKAENDARWERQSKNLPVPVKTPNLPVPVNTPKPSPAPKPTPSNNSGEQAAKDYLWRKSHQKWAERRDELRARKELGQKIRKGAGILGKGASAIGRGVLTAGKAAAKGAAYGTLAGAGIGATGLAVKNMRKIKAMKNKMNQLEARMNTAPPEQKGIIRRMIDRIKQVIHNLMSRIRG